MIYIVTEASSRGFMIHDGVTKEDKHPTRPGGQMFIPGPHAFQIGDKVQIHIKLVERKAQE